MSGYTEGPWDFDEDDFTIYEIATFEPIPNTRENARLRAAAPDLLEVLQAMVFALRLELTRSLAPHKDAYVPLIAEAEAVIAKARGES